MMTAPIWRPDFASQPSDGGFSLVELLVGAVLLTTMLYAVATLSVSGTAAADLAQRMTRISEVSQEIVDDMRLELVSSVRVFGNDAEGMLHEPDSLAVRLVRDVGVGCRPPAAP